MTTSSSNTGDKGDRLDRQRGGSLAAQRRAGRERALQTLYAVEVGKRTVDEVLDEAQEAAPLDEKTLAFARALIEATLRSRGEIDPVLDKLATGFPLARQTVVDRNILRMAAAEILFRASDAPPGAVVNEAVELAKKFSTGESGRFVNGVLGALVRDQERQAVATEEDAPPPAPDRL
jgi:N utilization substance protein B